LSELPERYAQWTNKTVELANLLETTRKAYPECKNWTQPIVETIRYIMFSEEPEWLRLLRPAVQTTSTEFDDATEKGS